MAIQTYSLCDVNNIKVLTSIASEGLIPKAPCCIPSNDEKPYSRVALNIIGPTSDQENAKFFIPLNESIKQLMYNSGNGVLPIIAERKHFLDSRYVHFEKSPDRFSQRITEIFESSVLFVINTRDLTVCKGYHKIDAKFYKCGGNFEIAVNEVPKEALLQALVPEKMMDIFKRCCPDIPCCSIPSSKQLRCLFIPQDIRESREFPKREIAQANAAAGFDDDSTLSEDSDSDSENGGDVSLIFRFFTTDVPDYATKVRSILEEHFAAHPDECLGFHVVRLACSEDLPFIKKQDDEAEADIASSAS